MPLIHCPDCGTSVSEHALMCPKCSYPVQRIKQPQQMVTILNDIGKQNDNNGLIVSGYIMACVSLLFYPILFLTAGIVVGIVTISKGSIGHGVAHIVLSLVLGVIGVLLGVFSYLM